MDNNHIIPRDLSIGKIKNYLFPDLSSIDPKLMDIFYGQAGTSLFLLMATTSVIGVMIFGISLISEIQTLILVRSIIGLLVFFAVVLGIHKLIQNKRKDFYLLAISAYTIVTWGVLKDIFNFGITFNSYGILFIAVVFFGIVFMPFQPKFSLILSSYAVFLYSSLSILLIYQLFGHDWMLHFGEYSRIQWLDNHFEFIAGKGNLPRHPGFLIGWHLIQYFAFGLIAFVFRAANLQSFIKTFIAQKQLSSKENQLVKLQKMLLSPENQHLEFKSSARWDYHQGKTNKGLEKVIVKTIAGFMNADGGILFIGVDDDGKVLGLQNDYNSLYKKDSDGYEQYLIGLISNYLGTEFCRNLDINFFIIDQEEVCSIDVIPSSKPVFVEKLEQAFFVRTGNNTQKLMTKEALDYIESRFNKTEIL